MSSISQSISPDDPRFNEVQELGFQLPPHAPAIQRRMHHLLLDDKLRRLLQCREYSKYVKCKNNHIHCTNSSRCGLHFACADCAEWVALERCRKYAGLRQFVASKFVYVTITAKEPANGASLRLRSKTLSRFLRSLPTRAIFKLTVSDKRTPELRLIYSHPGVTTEQIAVVLRERFPGCTVLAYAHFQDQFYPCMEQLNAPPTLTPKDPYRADLEYMFEGIRTFHVLGFSRVELSVCKSENGHTSNSTDEKVPSEVVESFPGDPTTEGFEKCRICNEPLNFISRWYPTAGIPRAEEVKFTEYFHIIPPESPPD